jgi:hypothetical protein
MSSDIVDLTQDSDQEDGGHTIKSPKPPASTTEEEGGAAKSANGLVLRRDTYRRGPASIQLGVKSVTISRHRHSKGGKSKQEFLLDVQAWISEEDIKSVAPEVLDAYREKRS